MTFPFAEGCVQLSGVSSNPGRFTVEQFIEVLDSYIRWYNAKRIKISLGALSPLEYRESLGIAA